MDCTEYRLLMTARIDNELDAATMAQFAAHVANCPECEEEYEALSGLSSDVRMHGERYAAPAHLKQRILSALPHRPPVSREAGKWPWAWINFGAALASSAAFVVTLGLYMAAPTSTNGLEEDVVSSHYRSLLVGHLTDVASSDQHMVKPWFTGKLDFSPPAYDFAARGYTLIGGRLDYLHGRTVAALVYQHRQHIVNLFVWPEQGKDGTAQQSVSRQGFQLLAWSDHGLRYWAISDAAPQDLAELRNLLDAQIRGETSSGSQK
ncbi:anti-sigma factor family protein [Noviherbaspirillum galbum]|uniref:Anti-sigma factor n=1 Tax=Noviherbaspirillum galbum TaxID=2709383 RepID=A0A6B3SYW5_9BURK|nr:anti-sigma factor [Noviherbaspirillum galbum]NEX64886.1 anti-sigma factor [Noviherbaspirillum galbum]